MIKTLLFPSRILSIVPVIHGASQERAKDRTATSTGDEPAATDQPAARIVRRSAGRERKLQEEKVEKARK